MCRGRGHEALTGTGRSDLVGQILLGSCDTTPVTQQCRIFLCIQTHSMRRQHLRHPALAGLG